MWITCLGASVTPLSYESNFFVFQFGISGAAVARVWADKFSEWVAIGAETEMRRFWVFVLDPCPSLGISPLAGLLQALCVLVLLRGMEMGKRVTTIMTALKVTHLLLVVDAFTYYFHTRGGMILSSSCLVFT